jgi:phosphoenolpyruvate carboxylase
LEVNVEVEPDQVIDLIQAVHFLGIKSLLNVAATMVAHHLSEFWKHIPLSEPFRLLLGDMRDKLHNSRERMRQLLATGKCDIPVEDTYTDAAQILEPLELCHRSLCAMGDKPITDGSLLDFMRQVSCLKLDIRQESDRHTDAIDCSN